MPFTFILAIIFAVPALAAAVLWAVAKPLPPPPAASSRYASQPVPVKVIGKLVTLVLGGLAVLLTLLSLPATVSTQNIGIITSFGRPVGHLSNGLHLTAPWVDVTEMDGAIQTSTPTDPRAGCTSGLPVRIASQQTACAPASIQWRIRPSAADALFRNYHDFAGVENSLITRRLAVALNTQFQAYDPIASLTSAIPSGRPGNPTVNQLAVLVQAQMRSEIGSQIEVISVLIPPVTYDATVQGRINTVLAQTAQTDVALQAERTAAAQAAANKLLSSSVSNDPNVLVSKCLDLVNEAIKAGYALPPGFSCFGSSPVGVIAGTPAGSGRK